MARSLRIEFSGALHYVTCRGNAGGVVFGDAIDGARFIELLGREVEQSLWLCHAYCLLGDHYHLLVETPEANLGRGMGRLNMTYSQCFNRRHGRNGHLFQGRFRSILVEKQSHLLQLARHVVLNPVRTGQVPFAHLWRWSSFRATALGNPHQPWVHGGDLFDMLGGGDEAIGRFAEYVAAGAAAPSPWGALKGGHFLGGEAFRGAMAARLDAAPGQKPPAAHYPDRPDADEVLAAVARAAGLTPGEVLDRKGAFEAFRATVYLLRRACNLPLKQVAAMAGVSPGRISQIQRMVEDCGGLAGAYPWAGAIRLSRPCGRASVPLPASPSRR